MMYGVDLGDQVGFELISLIELLCRTVNKFCLEHRISVWPFFPAFYLFPMVRWPGLVLGFLQLSVVILLSLYLVVQRSPLMITLLTGIVVDFFLSIGYL